MKLIYLLLILFHLFATLKVFGQDRPLVNSDSIVVNPFNRGTKHVNQCTPWDHLKCVYITGVEVYKDGSEGKATRHWWRMSYIGRACTAQHGTFFGKVFEGVFAVPHYMGIAIGNGVGLLVYLVRGSPEKVKARKLKRQSRRENRE